MMKKVRLNQTVKIISKDRYNGLAGKVIAKGKDVVESSYPENKGKFLYLVRAEIANGHFQNKVLRRSDFSTKLEVVK